MKKFMDENFLLRTDTARKLYHEYAQQMPIIDYHCHINPREIAEDKKFKNITEIWLYGDHYKWRLMRSNGVAEHFITGDASDFEKFEQYAKTLARAIGNPLYHWSHLELKRYFGYDGALNGETAKAVWDICNQKIKTDGISARSLIQQSNVAVIGTTDDPIDDLVWHEKIEQDKTFTPRVLPMWRPDRAVGIEKADYLTYLEQLSQASGVKITSFTELKAALQKRLDYFAERGCLGSDHGLSYLPYEVAAESIIENIFWKRLSGELLTDNEIHQFQTALLLFLSTEYAKRDWVMQFHVGVTRNNNSRMFAKLGADTGFDGIYPHVSMEQMTAFLNDLDQRELLPKTILYSLNPNDNAVIGTMLGCFRQMQQGSAWWFNDHEMGMREQMSSLASLGILGNFIGMLTDSRSFLSYTRHEYFRRIFCDLIGEWVESGRYPDTEKNLANLVQDICHNNVKKYFGF